MYIWALLYYFNASLVRLFRTVTNASDNWQMPFLFLKKGALMIGHAGRLDLHLISIISMDALQLLLVIRSCIA